MNRIVKHIMIVRSIFLFAILLLCSCQSNPEAPDFTIEEFQEMAQKYQELYMDGGANCELILMAMHKSIRFSENGKNWSYSDLEKYCPHLPKKEVISTVNDQRLLNPTLGYDWVSQLFTTSKGDTVRETASRIWQKDNDTWKIIQMNNLLEFAADQ